MATRSDVAKLAGVSTAVVSYVINDGPRPVASSTRKKVEDAIAVLGYRPNIHAAVLRGGKTRTVAALLPNLTNPFFAEFAELLHKLLFEQDYNLTVSIVQAGSAHEREVVRSIVARGVDAVIYTSVESHANTQHLLNQNTQVALFNCAETISNAVNVRADYAALTQSAVEFLRFRGHSLIGLLAGPRSLKESSQQVTAWRRSLSDAGLPHGKELVVHSDHSPESAANAAAVLFDSDGAATNRYSRSPTAVVVASDVQALGLIQKCANLGISVPDQLALISLEGTRLARFTQPPLTTVRQPLEYMCDELVLRIASENAFFELSVDGNVVAGGTA